MNIYDFDHTIYDGDSTIDFYWFCLRKKPYLIFYLPIQILSFVLFKLNRISKLDFKQSFYGFLKLVNCNDEMVKCFWEKNKRKIKSWYLENQSSNDLIISASPDFLLRPICNILNIEFLIASNVDVKTGRCLSENCYGEEKVNRLFAEYPSTVIYKFYSDSLSDLPLAILAEKSYFVYKHKIVKWEDNHLVRKKRIFFSGDFLLFIMVGCVNAINGIIFSFLFSLIFNHSLAFIFGYITSVLISYVLNSIIVFKSSLNLIKLWKFVLSYIPNFIVQLIVVELLLRALGLHQIIVYSVAAIVGIPVTFLLLKFFAFKKD